MCSSIIAIVVVVVVVVVACSMYSKEWPKPPRPTRLNRRVAAPILSEAISCVANWSDNSSLHSAAKYPKYALLRGLTSAFFQAFREADKAKKTSSSLASS